MNFSPAAILDHPPRPRPGGDGERFGVFGLDRETAAAERHLVEQGIVGGEGPTGGKRAIANRASPQDDPRLTAAFMGYSMARRYATSPFTSKK